MATGRTKLSLVLTLATAIVFAELLVAITYSASGTTSTKKITIKRDGPGIRIVDPRRNETLAVIRFGVLDKLRGKEVEVRRLPNGTLALLTDGHSVGVIKQKEGAAGRPSPNITRTTEYTSGAVPPYGDDFYGPYFSVVNLNFDISWSATAPAFQTSWVCVGYIDLDTRTVEATCNPLVIYPHPSPLTQLIT